MVAYAARVANTAREQVHVRMLTGADRGELVIVIMFGRDGEPSDVRIPGHDVMPGCFEQAGDLSELTFPQAEPAGPVRERNDEQMPGRLPADRRQHANMFASDDPATVCGGRAQRAGAKM